MEVYTDNLHKKIQQHIHQKVGWLIVSLSILVELTLKVSLLSVDSGKIHTHVAAFLSCLPKN